MKACIKPISMLMLSFMLSVFATGFVFQANTAQAAINAVSAGRNFANFPQWYEDLAAGGVRVQLCLGTNPDGTGLADPNCVLPTLPPLEPNYDPTQAISFPGNFPSEAFYWIADSEIPAIGTGGDRARLRVALEGAFASGTPQAGQQITFLRVNLTGITGLAPNSTYDVTYPYGTFQITTDGTGNTIDTGNAAFRAEDPITPVAISILPTAYELLLPATDTHVSSFLRWTTGAPAGYLGDGATPHAVTGGTNGNLFRIAAASGPATTADIDPLVAGVQTSIQTNLFSVAGKMVILKLTEVTKVPLYTTDTTPAYVFNSTEAGTITYGGACASPTISAVAGDNTITFDALAIGAYNNCTVTVTNAGGVSATLNVTPFNISAFLPDTIGLFRSGKFFLRNVNSSGPSSASFNFGISTDIPISGDWNGDGTDTIGVFRSGKFFLRNTNSTGGSDVSLSFGQAGDIPISGDWNGDGTDTIGVFRSGKFFLRNTNSTGGSDVSLSFGQAGDIPISGDWNGDGTDTIGVFRSGKFFLRNTNSTGGSDVSVSFGLASDKPIVGDWNGDGTDTVGVFRSGKFFLRNTNSSGPSNASLNFGQGSDKPVSGKWGL